MIVIPAIDIIEKKVVRLTQGDFNRETFYSDDPVEVARKWQSHGAELIHIVDLDGARTGEPKNLDIVSKIAKAVDIPVQAGGGLRTMESVDMALSTGASRVIVGTRAATDTKFIKDLVESYRERIVVSIDVIGTDVMASGWIEQVPRKAAELACDISRAGVSTIIFSNITYDGTLQGIKSYWVEDMLDAANKADVIIAGGVSSIDDIVALKEISISRKNLYGVITGKAIYEGKLDLKQAIKTTKEK